MSGGENITKLNAAGDQQETEFTEMPAVNANDSKTRLSGASENGSETDAFLGTAKDDLEARKVDGYDKEADGQGNEHFYGLSREELEKYANDPVWVKTRRVLFAILVVGWVAMLVSAIIIVVVTEKCPKNPNLLWYQDGLAYRVDTAKFQDSDANGVGDFTGMYFSNIIFIVIIYLLILRLGPFLISFDKFSIFHTFSFAITMVFLFLINYKCNTYTYRL